jgi:beta-N-acetylhexosaminidase
MSGATVAVPRDTIPASASPASAFGGSAHRPFPRAATACASETLAKLSLEQRVGQLFLLGIGVSLDKVERDLIERHHVGSVTFAGFVRSGVAGVRRVADSIGALATEEATHGIGFLVGANQEGGRVQALSGTGFSRMPTALKQGRLTTDRLKADATDWGRQLVEAGVNLDLAPVGDTVPKAWVSRNAPIGQLKREFGPSPGVVGTHVKAFIEGMHDAQVLTTVKHFPGLGRVTGNTDFTSGVRDRVTTRDSAFLRPFRTAVEAGVPFVMTSLASYAHLDGRTLAAFSRPITTGLLRESLGFTGVIVSDDLSAVAVRSVPAGQRALRFLRAGGDLITVTVPRDARAMVGTLVEKAGSSASLRRKVDEAALRVLRAKESAGLLDCGAAGARQAAGGGRT